MELLRKAIRFKVRCTVCKVELAFSNSTGTMLNHLKCKHPGCIAGAGASSSTSSLGSQRPVDTFIVRHCPPGKAEQLTNKLTDMVVIDLLPISVVEGKGFRGFLSVCEPGYAPPGRKLITTRLEQRYLFVTLILMQTNNLRW